MCKWSFDCVDEMLHHFNYEEHDYVDSKTVTQLSTVADKWVKRFAAEDDDALIPSCSQSEDVPCASDGETELTMGWAIP